MLDCLKKPLYLNLDNVQIYKEIETKDEETGEETQTIVLKMPDGSLSTGTCVLQKGDVSLKRFAQELCYQKALRSYYQDLLKSCYKALESDYSWYRDSVIGRIAVVKFILKITYETIDALHLEYGDYIERRQKMLDEKESK